MTNELIKYSKKKTQIELSPFIMSLSIPSNNFEFEYPYRINEPEEELIFQSQLSESEFDDDWWLNVINIGLVQSGVYKLTLENTLEQFENSLEQWTFFSAVIFSIRYSNSPQFDYDSDQALMVVSNELFNTYYFLIPDDNVYLFIDDDWWDTFEYFSDSTITITKLSEPSDSTLNEIDCYINWGDGTPIQHVTNRNNLKHTYSIAGTYDFEISGKISPPIFGLVSQSIKNCVNSIKNWGNFDDKRSKDWSFAFYRCSNLLSCSVADSIKPFGVDFNATDTKYMFYYANNFNSDLSNWNVSNVTDMSYMFSGASNFNSDISNWNVSNVSIMLSMFQGASSFNQDLPNWDVSNVTNMSFMFSRPSSFNSDISNWNVSNVVDMSQMFRNASSFNSDLSNWNVSNVVVMSFMFTGASNFNSDISNWNVSNVTNMLHMFNGASSFNSDISNWNVSNVEYMSWMFKKASSFNSDLSNWNVSNVIDMSHMFVGASSFNSDISNWNVSNVTNMSWMSSGASSFNSDISNWNVSNVIDMSFMFCNTSNFNADLSNWNVSNVKNMNCMFWNATNFDADLSNWNVSNVKEYYIMFEGCKNPNVELLRILKLRDL